MKQIYEDDRVKQIQGDEPWSWSKYFKSIKPPVWAGSAFILLCVILSLVAAATVRSHPEDPVEFKISERTYSEYVNPSDGGRKVIYWRVRSTEVPRWKRFANRWKKVRSCRFFWESEGGYTRDYDPKYHPRWYHQNAEMSTEHTVDQYKQIQNDCRTVGEMKKYLKHEKAKYRTGTRRYIEKKKEKAEKERIKNIWEEAKNDTAAADCGSPHMKKSKKKSKKIW